MSSKEMSIVVEGLPKLHTCSIWLGGLIKSSVDRFVSVLHRGVLRRVAMYPYGPCLPVQHLERLLAEFRAAGIPLVFRFPRFQYSLDFWVESVSVERPPHTCPEFLHSELKNFDADDLRTLVVHGGFVTARVATRRWYWKEYEDDPVVLGPLVWPEYDSHRFGVSRLGDPRLAALGPPPTAAP